MFSFMADSDDGCAPFECPVGEYRLAASELCTPCRGIHEFAYVYWILMMIALAAVVRAAVVQRRSTVVLDMTRALLFTVQTVSFLATLDYNWPTVLFFSMFETGIFSAELGSFGAPCLTPPVPLWLLAVMQPLLLSLLLAGYHALEVAYLSFIIGRFRTERRLAAVRRFLVAALASAAAVVHFPATAAAMEVFSCVESSDGCPLHVDTMPDIACNSGEHKLLMSAAVIVLIVFSFGMPFAAAAWLYTKIVSSPPPAAEPAPGLRQMPTASELEAGDEGAPTAARLSLARSMPASASLAAVAGGVDDDVFAAVPPAPRATTLSTVAVVDGTADGIEVVDPRLVFFAAKYRRDAYWWESMSLIKRIMMPILSYAIPSLYVASALMFLLELAYLIAVMRLVPFRTPSFQHIEMVSSACILALLFTGSFFLSNIDGGSAVFFILLTFAALGAFVLTVVWISLRLMDAERRRDADDDTFDSGAFDEVDEEEEEEDDTEDATASTSISEVPVRLSGMPTISADGSPGGTYSSPIAVRQAANPSIRRILNESMEPGKRRGRGARNASAGAAGPGRTGRDPWAPWAPLPNSPEGLAAASGPVRPRKPPRQRSSLKNRVMLHLMLDESTSTETTESVASTASASVAGSPSMTSASGVPLALPPSPELVLRNGGLNIAGIDAVFQDDAPESEAPSPPPSPCLPPPPPLVVLDTDSAHSDTEETVATE